MTFTVTAEGANGAYTHRSMGSILIAMVLGTTLATVVESIPVELPPRLKEYLAKPAVRQVTDEIMGYGAADNMLKATVNIGTIHGGVKTNLIPVKCVFEADICLPIGLTRETVLEHIDELLKMFPRTKYVIQETASHPASFQSFRHPFAKCIADAAEGVTGRRPIPLLGLGGTDCKFFRSRGVPAFVFGPSPSGMGGQGEAVLIEEFMAVVKTHTLAVFNFLRDGSLYE
jgi:succinyl-diaminopimelate desuccinylase